MIVCLAWPGHSYTPYYHGRLCVAIPSLESLPSSHPSILPSSFIKTSLLVLLLRSSSSTSGTLPKRDNRDMGGGGRGGCYKKLPGFGSGCFTFIPYTCRGSNSNIPGAGIFVRPLDYRSGRGRVSFVSSTGHNNMSRLPLRIPGRMLHPLLSLAGSVVYFMGTSTSKGQAYLENGALAVRPCRLNIL